MPKNSTRLTDDVIGQIKGLLATGKYYQHQIAAMFGINQGRVSEIANGLIGAGIAPVPYRP